jgi:hypothetical protein
MDGGKWIVLVLALAVGASEVILLRQNAQLKRQVAIDRVAARKTASVADRSLYEASLMGRCQPLYETAKTAATPTPARPLAVSLYFSLDGDCTSCVEDLVSQWNGVVQRTPGAALAVQGYTEIDGTMARRKLEGFRPAFPVANVEHLGQKLSAMGVKSTPVVFVSDPASGRILFTSSVPPGEKSDPAVAQRIEALAKPCG